MSDNVGTVCNAAGDSCARTFHEITEASSQARSDGAIDTTPVAVSFSNGENRQQDFPSPISEVQPFGKVEGTPISENRPEIHNVKDLDEVSTLKLEIRKRTDERDDYKIKLAETEKKLSKLQTAYASVTSGDGNEITLRKEKEDLRNKLTQTQLMLEDRGRLVANQQIQINAMAKQVLSLKEVVAITKDMLNIRNMEVKHLQDDVDTMESKITAERDRHNVMLSKMDAAVRLHADLKKEYETQLHLFQDLRGKYEQKVTLLSEENRALEAASQSAAVQ